MAKKVITTTEYIDDIDGTKAAVTVSFAYDGTSYEIDLSKKNSTAFAKLLQPYVDSARKARAGSHSTGRRRSAGRRASSSRADLSQVREWAKANGFEVAARGRVPAAVLEAYSAAS